MALGPAVNSMALEAAMREVSQNELGLRDVFLEEPPSDAMVRLDLDYNAPSRSGTRFNFAWDTQYSGGGSSGAATLAERTKLALRNAYQHIAFGEPLIRLTTWSQPGVQPVMQPRGQTAWWPWALGLVAAVGGGIYLWKRKR